jgi:uncharacterized protein YcbK (DUF882 family)
MKRRAVLLTGLSSLAGALPWSGALAGPTAAGRVEPARLKLYHIHTREALEVAYREHGLLQPDALAEIDHVLRDFRSDQAHNMDIDLLDILDTLYAGFGRRGRFEVISGFRSARSNEALRRATTGVAKDSFHLYGRAIDVRLTSAMSTDLRDAALALGAGGVGYYPASNFVHIDTGAVRSWQG